MNRPLRLAECSQPISWVFCVYFVGGRCIIATRQQCCCNAFRIHSRSVRNVFVICVLHIRHAKVWFLFFECWVVAICSQCYRNPSATFWQSVRSVIGNPSAAVGVRFIVPAYICSPRILCVFG